MSSCLLSLVQASQDEIQVSRLECQALDMGEAENPTCRVSSHGSLSELFSLFLSSILRDGAGS